MAGIVIKPMINAAKASLGNKIKLLVIYYFFEPQFLQTNNFIPRNARRPAHTDLLRIWLIHACYMYSRYLYFGLEL
jgi:hypothetical protein